MLGWSWAPSKPCDAHGKSEWVLTCRNLAALATASHRVRPNGDTTWGTLLQTKRYRWQKTWNIPVKTGVLRILDWAGHVPQFEAMWTSTWAEFAPTGQVAPSWSQVRPKLQLIGPSWAEVEALLAEVDPKSGQCCGHQIVQNYHSPVHFLARVPGRTCPPPPQLKLYQSDKSVRSYPSLLKPSRLGTFGAGGFERQVTVVVGQHLGPNMRNMMSISTPSTPIDITPNIISKSLSADLFFFLHWFTSIPPGPDRYLSELLLMEPPALPAPKKEHTDPTYISKAIQFLGEWRSGRHVRGSRCWYELIRWYIYTGSHIVSIDW